MCFFEGSAGTATIPVEALQHIDADPSPQFNGIGIGHHVQRCSVQAGYHLQTMATQGYWWNATIK